MPIDRAEVQKMLDAERAAIAPEKIAALEATDAMKAMIAVPDNTEAIYFEFGGLKIRHRRFLTKRLRQMMKMSQASVKVSDDPLAEQDTVVYQLLAEMCTEAPWTEPEAWRYVDLKTNDGRIYTIFFSLVMKMGGDEETLKDFRRK
jgi:hypothetical protein